MKWLMTLLRSIVLVPRDETRAREAEEIGATVKREAVRLHDAKDRLVRSADDMQEMFGGLLSKLDD